MMTVLERPKQNIVTRFLKCANGKIEFTDDKDTSVKCMGVYYANLPDMGNSTQKGIRPVLVVSNNKNNEFNSMVVVIPFTSKIDKRSLPVHVVFKEGLEEIGLKKESTLTCEQILTISKDNIRQNIGHLSRKIDALKVAAGICTQIPILSIL